MRVVGVCLLLLAALCCASAARVAPDASLIQDNAASVQRWMSDNLSKKDDKPAYIAFRYQVEPEDRKAFIDAWLKLEKDTKDEKGVVIFDLKKPITDNIEFVGYGEWKSFKDYMDHYESDHVQAFLDELDKNDIEWAIVPLERPDVAELHPEKEEKTEKEQAHVIIHYHVPPSAHKDFLDAWDRAEKGTEGEKGAHIYSLRKVFSDNTHYYAYGTWEKMEDYEDHFRSGHVKELRRSLDQHGIVWHLAPLFKVGSQPE